MGSWRETQLNGTEIISLTLLPEFPIHLNKGKRWQEGQMSPLTKSIIFKKFYQSTLQTPKPGFRPRPRGSQWKHSHILYIPGGPHPPGLTAELSASCMGGWWGQSQGASLFTLAKSGPAQLTALHESEARFPSRWWGVPNTVEMLCSRPALLKPALVIWLFKY